MATHYDVLGLPRSASDDAIATRCREFATVLHPDRGGDEVAFAVLVESYEVLSTPSRRARYDAELDALDNPQAAQRPATAVRAPFSSAEQRQRAARAARFGIQSVHQTPGEWLRTGFKRELVAWLVALPLAVVCIALLRLLGLW